MIPDVLETFDKWLRGDDIDLKKNLDHIHLAGRVMDRHILENAG